MTLATIAQADAEYAHNVGQMRREQPWILSDRDVWYANPFYQGPYVPHPEDDWGQAMAECERHFQELQDDAVQMCGLEI